MASWRARATMAFLRAAPVASVTAGVFAGAEPGVAGDLASIVKAVPVANLPIDHHTGHCTKAARLVESGRDLQLKSQRTDFLLQRNEDGLAVLKQLLDPSR